MSEETSDRTAKPEGHLLVIHRWIRGPADYASYVDHAKAAVSYVVNPRSQASVPAGAAAIVVVSDTTDLTQVRAAIGDPVSRFGPPDAVVAMQEGDLAVAAALRAEFGCPGRRPADLHHFLDKLAMLEAARAVGAEVPRYRVVRSAAELSLFAEQAGWPVVVKPLRGQASIGVRLVTGERDALAFDWTGPVLAQERVDLPVYHADGYFADGRIEPWRLARYVNVQGGQVHGPLAFNGGEPVGEAVVDDPAQLTAARDYLNFLIPRLSGLPWVFHLEFFLGREQCRWRPVFLEVGCRPGGGEIPYSWREVYDVDLLRLEFGLQRGDEPARPSLRHRDRIAGSLLVPLPAAPPAIVTGSTSMLGTADGPYTELIPEPGTAISAGAGYEAVGGRFRFAGASTAEVTGKILATGRAYRVTAEPAPPRDAVVIIGGTTRMPLLAAGLRLSVLALHQPTNLTDPAYQVCAETVGLDLLDEQAVVAATERLCRVHPVRRVVSTAEDGLLPAARVNERHGYGGNPECVVRRLKDKAEMRRHLAGLGISPVRYRLVHDADELAAFARTVDGLVIVKPLDEGGSKGISLVADPAQAATVWRGIEAGGRRTMLAEEYLTGREVSVEAFSAAGRHTVITVTDKLVGTTFVETGHRVPADLSDADWAAATALTTELLNAVGLVEGASHTELMLTAAGPRVVESHNRVGGDRIPDLVHAVYGIDLEKLSVGLPLGLMGWADSVPAAAGGAAVRFLTPAPGVVTEVTVPPDGLIPGAAAQVAVRPGDLIPPLTWSGDRVAGNVFATGATAAEAAHRADALAAMIGITTQP